MDLEKAFEESPFMELLGIELLDAEDGVARG
jgi:acyl-coenzyme A thioesterase PaaI-like protein